MILTDQLHRIAYATDASVYREMPLGVAYPRNDDDIVELIAYAREHHTHLIPRAGGTSIAGQVVGSGVVVDVSRYMNRVLEVNAAERWARVQPGVVRDELNMALRPYGLFFSPETSTSSRCCIGGMVGNNSCGTHSLAYGSTRHHVLRLKGVLSDGTLFDTAADTGSALQHAIYAMLSSWRQDAAVCDTIVANYPDASLRRRSCGYAIDEALGLTAQRTGTGGGAPIDMCALITGSEGTLAFVTEITVSLDPLPHHNRLLLCAHCDGIAQSCEANLAMLRHVPVAVELMDGKILALCEKNPAARQNKFFVEGEPGALVIAEFCGDDAEQRADDAERELASRGLSYCCTRVSGGDIERVWALRKAGLGVLTIGITDTKPVGVIEDTAVAPQRLADYLADFQQMLDRLSLECVYYGHIGTGELHLRPIINLKSAEGRRKFREVAVETARLVKKHRGSLSGEHGDGRLRGEFIPLVYGDECYRLMRQVKQLFDPDGVFNVGKIVDTPPMDSMLRYDVGQQYRCADSALMGAIEQCNGAADCRKSQLIGGTMCPAFKATGDELLSTRARANVLRELLTRGTGERADRVLMKQMLDTCLACKGCKRECPSNVDLTAIRAQVLQQIYDADGVPFGTMLVARMAVVQRIGHYLWRLYNFFASNRLTSSLIKSIVGFASQRRIPLLAPKTMRQLVAENVGKPQVARKRVYLFADEFTNYIDAELGLTFARLLTALGYEVVVPKHGESGRAAISKGCLKLARRHAIRNVTLLCDKVSDATQLVGIEPSTLLSFRDEYPTLVPPAMHDSAVALGRNSLLYDEFLLQEIRSGNIKASQFDRCDAPIYLHGHCHQKAIVGIDKTATVLATLLQAKPRVIASGCCGMAGSFGYEKHHYDTSLAVAELALFPAIREALRQHRDNGTPAPVVLAPGTSCRQQILDGLGVHAIHPIELLFSLLKR